jgi:hypothetical protein
MNAPLSRARLKLQLDVSFGDLHQLITHHHLDGDELTTALHNTASHRGIRLRSLSEAISDLPTRRQAPYTAWRRRQGQAAENHLATFADLVSTVIAFADPWPPAPRAGAPGTPPPELGRLHSRPQGRLVSNAPVWLTRCWGS